MKNDSKITLEMALAMLAEAKMQNEDLARQLNLAGKMLDDKEAELVKKENIITEKNRQISDQKVKIDAQYLKLLETQEKLAAQLRYRFCAHSEKADTQPYLFDFEDDEFIPPEEEIEETVSKEGPFKETVVKEHKRKVKKGKKPLDPTIPRVEKLNDIPEEEKICGCGARLVKISEKRTERLVIRPAEVYVEVTVTPVYACKECEGSGDEDKPVFRQAKQPKQFIARSIATSSTLSFVFANKFANYTPYYRQEKAFERRLIDISRQDMTNWQMMAYEKLKPLEKILIKYIKSGKTMNLDETTVRVLKYEKSEDSDNKNSLEDSRRQKSYIWLGVGGPAERKAVIYRYFKDRDDDHVHEFIDDFTGWVQTDEYAGYDSAINKHNSLSKDKQIVHVACLAHIRRRFWEASKVSVNAKEAEKAVNYIRKIYRIENSLRETFSGDELVSKRHEQIEPIMKEFHGWLLKKQPEVPPSLKFGEAIRYALNAWEKMMHYLDCPELYVDNSISERSIRPFVMGRKNFLFCGNENGARSACLLYTLIENAKLNGLNPEDYLRTIFDLAVDTDSWTDKEWAELLPWNIKIKPLEPHGPFLVDKGC